MVQQSDVFNSFKQPNISHQIDLFGVLNSDEKRHSQKLFNHFIWQILRVCYFHELQVFIDCAWNKFAYNTLEMRTQRSFGVLHLKFQIIFEQNDQIFGSISICDGLEMMIQVIYLFLHENLEVGLFQLSVGLLVKVSMSKNIDKPHNSVVLVLIKNVGLYCGSIQLLNKKTCNFIAKTAKTLAIIAHQTHQVADRSQNLCSAIKRFLSDHFLALESLILDDLKHVTDNLSQLGYLKCLLGLFLSKLYQYAIELFMLIQDELLTMQILCMSKSVILTSDKCALEILLHLFMHAVMKKLSFSVTFDNLLAHLMMVHFHHLLLFTLKHLVSQINIKRTDVRQNKYRNAQPYSFIRLVVTIIILMNKPVTKYLLLVPLAYVGYCFFEDQLQRREKQQLINQKEGTYALSQQYNRFNKSNIFKRSLKKIRNFVTEPTNKYPEIIDCDVIDSGQTTGSFISYPYHTKTTIRVNKFNQMDSHKSGVYNVLFWTHLKTRQLLRLTQTEASQQAVSSMLSKRESKCHEIAKNSMPVSNSDYQSYFLECVRKSQGAARLLEKEMEKIKMIREYRRL